MKRNKTLFSALLISLLVSCEPAVTFREPQPVGCRNESDIPAGYRGFYRSLLDSTSLVIGDRAICRLFEVNLGLSLKNRDSSYSLMGDSLLDIQTGIRYPSSKKGDSVFVHVTLQDTLFDMSDSGLVRKWKGYCFLNKKYDSKGWEVSKLTLRKGLLTIGSVKDTSDIQQLRALSFSGQDTIPPYQVSLDRRAFKKFLKEGGFRTEETFVRERGLQKR